MRKIKAAALLLCAVFLLSAALPGCVDRGVFLSGLKAGDIVEFGSCEQDGNPDNGAEAIEWQVLAAEDGAVFLISRYGLDCKPYNREYADVTWETCSLRRWLNGDFYDEVFSDSEKKAIVKSKVSAGANPKYGTDPGGDTEDHVFLLSIEEAESYFASDALSLPEGRRRCRATKYTRQKGAYIGEEGGSWWWLRSPGGGQSSAASVSDNGEVNRLGYYVSNGFYTVRPVLRLRTGAEEKGQETPLRAQHRT